MPAKDSSLISNVWGQRSLGLDLSIKLTSATQSATDHICNTIYPYLQVISSCAALNSEFSVKFVPVANSGLTIFDYGDALCVSRSYGVYGKQLAGQKWLGHDGSILEQINAVSVVSELVAQRGWDAELISGTPEMKRLLWVESKRHEFKLVGYTPSANDERLLKFLMKKEAADGLDFKREYRAPQAVVASAGKEK